MLVSDDPLDNPKTQDLERMAMLIADKLCHRVLDIVQSSILQAQGNSYCLTMQAMENSRVFYGETDKHPGQTNDEINTEPQA